MKNNKEFITREKTNKKRRKAIKANLLFFEFIIYGLDHIITQKNIIARFLGALIRRAA